MCVLQPLSALCQRFRHALSFFPVFLFSVIPLLMFFGFSYCVPFTDALILWLAVLHCVHQTFSHYSLFLVVFFSMQLISAHTRSLNATVWYLTCKYLRNCTNTFFILLFKVKYPYVFQNILIVQVRNILMAMNL